LAGRDRKPWQRTPVNTEAKLLMLQHAFEDWHCIRVNLRPTCSTLDRAQPFCVSAAKEEGIFRHHMVTDSGRLRDTVYFSVIDDEWPDVKARLQALLARPWVNTGEQQR